MFVRSGRRKSLRWVFALVLVVGLLVGRALSIAPRPPKDFTRQSPLVIAHQGASGHAPSNTMVAFEMALAMGADVLEIDVHMTRDGVIVISHDATIDRMSNGTGYISSMTLAQLRHYDFGYQFTPDGGRTFPYRGKGVTIPTLEELFKAYPNVLINIELKQVDPPTEVAVWELVRRYQMERQVLLVSFHQEPMNRWRALAGERVAMGPPVRHMYLFAALYLTRLDWLYNPKYDAFQVPVAQRAGPITLRFDTDRFLKLANRLGMAVHYWTINEEAEIRRLYALGANGVMTDYPDRAVKALREMGLRK